MNLTENFPLAEFLRSQVAARLGLVLDPPPDVIANLKRLCVLVLQPARISVGRPIVVSSGWRPDWLNAAVNGASSSAHIDGRAADCNCVGMTPLAFARSIQRMDLPIDKVILEFGQWVHVQVAKEGQEPRREYLTARHIKGQTVYEVGLNP